LIDSSLPPAATGARASIRSIHRVEFTIVAGELLLTTAGTSNARRLCPLDTNLLQMSKLG
jgi:hypothetical protein